MDNIILNNFIRIKKNSIFKNNECRNEEKHYVRTCSVWNSAGVWPWMIEILCKIVIDFVLLTQFLEKILIYIILFFTLIVTNDDTL